MPLHLQWLILSITCILQPVHFPRHASEFYTLWYPDNGRRRYLLLYLARFYDGPPSRPSSILLLLPPTAIASPRHPRSIIARAVVTTTLSPSSMPIKLLTL